MDNATPLQHRMIDKMEARYEQAQADLDIAMKSKRTQSIYVAVANRQAAYNTLNNYLRKVYPG